MDFFQFLQLSKENSNDKSNINLQKIENNVQHLDTNIDDTTNENCIGENDLSNENCIDIYKNIRKGSMVKIIHVNNSILNSYKGYIGEIKNYKYGQDFALVFLHSIQHKCIIKFPLKHLMHIE